MGKAPLPMLLLTAWFAQYNVSQWLHGQETSGKQLQTNVTVRLQALNCNAAQAAAAAAAVSNACSCCPSWAMPCTADARLPQSRRHGVLGPVLSACLAGCTSRAMRSWICCVALGGVRDSSAAQLGSAPGPRELQSWTSSVSPVSACSRRGICIAASKDTPRSLERAQAARCVSRWQGNTGLKLWRLSVPGRK